MGLYHFARGAGILSFGVIVEIAPADRRQMKQRRERDQGSEKRMAQSGRGQRRRFEQRVFNSERAGTGRHICPVPRYFFQSSGNRSAFPAGICTSATICRQSAMSVSSDGRVI